MTLDIGSFQIHIFATRFAEIRNTSSNFAIKLLSTLLAVYILDVNRMKNILLEKRNKPHHEFLKIRAFEELFKINSKNRGSVLFLVASNSGDGSLNSKFNFEVVLLGPDSEIHLIFNAD